MLKTLILPAYNEEKYIGDIVKRGLKNADKVIVIDNCSSDRTYQIAESAGAITLSHCYNLGKAGSMKTGCEAAIRLGSDIIAFMDSDGQHKPEDLPRFYNTLLKENFDMVIGVRCLNKDMPWARRLGTKMIRIALKILFGMTLKDVQSGFRIFRASLYDKIKWTSTGSAHYFADAEISIRAGINKLKYKELPIETIFLEKNKGMHVIQGFYLLAKILWWRISLWK